MMTGSGYPNNRARLLHSQSLNFSESYLVTAFLLWSAVLRAQSGAQLMPAVHLVRIATTEVRFKLPIQLWLHNHCPQRIQSTNGC